MFMNLSLLGKRKDILCPYFSTMRGMLYLCKELFKFGFEVYLKALPLAEFHFKFEGPYKSGKIPKLKLKISFTFVRDSSNLKSSLHWVMNNFEALLRFKDLVVSS
jgi:hypothetical protein